MLFETADGKRTEHERLWVVQDPPTGLRAIIALHSRRLGPAFGGIRRRTYASEGEALDDVRMLARTMTDKCALAELEAGGGKAVVFDHPGLDVARAYEALGRAVDELGGAYICGPDMGTGPAEIERVRSATRHVNPAGNDAGASTARGVVAGLRAACRHRLGTPDFAEVHFWVQGLGVVGEGVTRTLIAEGATVSAFDVDPAKARVAEAMGATWLGARGWIDAPEADVFVPCALGGVIDVERADELQVAAVCGSANGVVSEAAAADRLRERGITLIPDAMVSSGAVIEGVMTYFGGTSPEVRARVAPAIDAIEGRCLALLAQAESEGSSTLAVVREWVRQRLTK